MTGSTRDLHITVGSSFLGKSSSLERELELTKIALLYGDRARLCSLKATYLFAFLPDSHTTIEEQIDLLLGVLRQIIKRDEPPSKLVLQLFLYFGSYREFSKVPHRNEHQERKYQELQMDIYRHWPETQAKARQVLGVAEILGAAKTGLLDHKVLDAGKPIEGVLQDFLDVVSEAVCDERTHPLLDDTAGAMVAAAIRDGRITLPEADRRRARHIGLAGRLLEGLPMFERASIDETLDIRRELDGPLKRFRSAIIRFSDGIEQAPWDKGFKSEADSVFHTEIAPAIEEIQDAAQSNRYLDELVRRATGHPSTTATVAGGLALVISRLPDLPQILALSAGLANALDVSAKTAALILPLVFAWSTYKDWEAKSKAIADKQLFFYYRAGQRLEEAARKGTRKAR